MRRNNGNYIWPVLMRPGRDFISQSREISTHVLMHDSSCRTRYRFYIGERERERRRENRLELKICPILAFSYAPRNASALSFRGETNEGILLFYPLMGNGDVWEIGEGKKDGTTGLIIDLRKGIFRLDDS